MITMTNIRHEVIIISNDEDRPSAYLLENALKSVGYSVVVRHPNEYEITTIAFVKMPNFTDGGKTYIIIGGHKAPDTGVFSELYLSEEEKRILEQPGGQVISGPHYQMPIIQGYEVYVLAGTTAADTRRTVENFIMVLGIKPEVKPPVVPLVPEKVFGIPITYIVIGSAALIGLLILTRRR
ncbi:MAG: hypothetical protein ACTSX6_00135 [Candidatus Heimdallarchaeaceae archaeon]